MNPADPRQVVATTPAGVARSTNAGATFARGEGPGMEYAVKLRTAVTDLALGDNIISQCCHGLAEPHDPPPRDWINGYPDVVDTWVFGHLCGLLPEQASSLAGSE
ncbi:hypothetical protein [Streptomyces vietnamensis]|uniref:hypothetical protein n=1 Tax=Streptomyces vietnamensis TaxID=362257 RepID=UPI003447B85C